MQKEKIVEWIKNYFIENAAPDAVAVIGISGGKDSTIVAALCVEALGAERVLGVLMPQGEQSDIDVSYAVCEYLKIPWTKINIGETVYSLYDAIHDGGGERKFRINGLAMMNTPARIRMTTLYAISSIVDGRVVNTCNACETFVGWETKYGDSAGDFSPVGDLTVNELKSVGYELGLPDKFIEKIPLDGLCGKTDEEALGFTYEELDKFIHTGVCDNLETKEKILELHRQSEHKRNKMPMYIKSRF
ncbi:MAG: NAD(+) synthase [Oscillospiraceae bacterium]|nr:NAD(+) synthase [Oscillospiraceae bacterium]